MLNLNCEQTSKNRNICFPKSPDVKGKRKLIKVGGMIFGPSDNIRLSK